MTLRVRTGGWAAVAVFGAALAAYLRTLYPSVPGGDSGEFIVAASRLGVAHPPGYPLFTILGWLSSLQPWGSIAWRVNALTATLGAGSAAVLCSAIWRLTASRAAAIVGAGIFAFSPLVWRYSIQAEVFTLNNLMLAILLWLTVRQSAEPSLKTFYLASLVLGLGLANHHTLILTGGILWLSIGWLVRAERSLSAAGRALAALAAGLSPHLYLVAAPADHPATTWGATSGPGGLLAHLLRRQYGTLRLGTMETGGSAAGRHWDFLRQLPEETFWVVPLLAGFALLQAARGRLPQGLSARPLASAAAALAAYLVIFHAMARVQLDDPFWFEVFSRFWLQANLLVCFIGATGLALLPPVRRSPRLAAAMAAIAVVVQFAVQLPAADRRHDRRVEQFARAALEGLPQNALVVSKGDLYWNTLRYLQFCEGLRPDVELLDIELLKAPWMNRRVREHLPRVSLPAGLYRSATAPGGSSYDLARLFEANRGRPLFSNALEHGDASWQTGWQAWPFGPWSRLYPKHRAVDLDRWLLETSPPSTPTEEPSKAPPPGSWEAIAVSEQAAVGSRRAAHLLNEAIRRKLDRGYVEQARAMLELRVSRPPEPTAATWLNLGIACFLLREHDPTLIPRMKEAWQHYLRLAPGDAPQRPAIEQALRDPTSVDLGLSGAR